MIELARVTTLKSLGTMSTLIACGAIAACNTGASQGQAVFALDGDAGVTEDAYAPPPEPEITVVREFTCDPLGIEPDQAVAEVAGTAGDEVLIRETPEPCNFDLVYRSFDSVETVLSASSNGYLLVAAADRVVCASPIYHQPDGEGGSTHIIEQIPLDCSLRSSSGVWHPLERLVDPAGEWAAWVTSVTREDADTYTIGYMRDFSFQLMNIGNVGRPPEDGVYEQTVKIVDDALVPWGAPILITTDFTQPTMEEDEEDEE